MKQLLELIKKVRDAETFSWEVHKEVPAKLVDSHIKLCEILGQAVEAAQKLEDKEGQMFLDSVKTNVDNMGEK